MTRYNINLDRCDKDVTLFMKSYTKRVIKKNCKQTRKELNSADTKFRPTEALVFRGNKISAAFEQNKNNYCTAPPQIEHSESHVAWDVIFLTDWKSSMETSTSLTPFAIKIDKI